MSGTKDGALFLVVVCSMAVLFLLPRAYFVPATFASTSVMLVVAFASGAFKGGKRPSVVSIVVGLSSAVLLYAVFYAGNIAIRAANIPGLEPPSESAIYSLIASPSNPIALQAAVLLFDAAGYESYFRGTVQKKLTPRLGPWAAPSVAILDAGLHILTLNLLWVATTFIADLAWGFTYRFGKGAQASFTSHFVWDIAIFLLRPIT